MSMSKSRDLLCQFQQRDDSHIDGGGLSKKINDGRFLLQCLNGKLRVLGMEKRITSERKISLKLIRCSCYINGRKLQQGLVNKNNNGGGGGGCSREELDEFVKMMREAQPYFKAHGGSTFVVVLSGNVVDSSYLFPILEGNEIYYGDEREVNKKWRISRSRHQVILFIPKVKPLSIFPHTQV